MVKETERSFPQRAADRNSVQMMPAVQGINRGSVLPVIEQPIKLQEKAIIGVDRERDILPDISNEPLTPGVDSARVQEFNRVLTMYKSGKASVDRRVVEAERWWKMRHSFKVKEELSGKTDAFEAVTCWMHNVVMNKHADAMEAYPRANVKPREEADKLDAWLLSKIIPVILEQNEFENTYSDCMWQKLKTGTGVYMVTWDREKLNGLGDINIQRASLLNVFWEPGINDIQESRFFFHVAAEDKDLLRAKYPQQLANEPNVQSTVTPVKMPADDYADTTNKVEVVDVYYKRDGKLHYCKYVGSTVIYATENDEQLRNTGLYDHGMYPFVFDSLFPVDESPAGYGFIDYCQNVQTRIDMMSTAMLRNTLLGALPRYFVRADGGVNEEEFMTLNNPLVHVMGNLGEDSIRVMDYKPLNGNYSNYLSRTIDELRETSSNTEVSTGSSTNGVTAAAAFAALQEASGKVSRDMNKTSYRNYGKVVKMVQELIRQFYSLPRQFRITGNMGVEKYITYTNAGIRPIAQGVLGAVDLGTRLPVFDIYVVPEKESRYTRLARNEMALEFYQMGFFNPNMTDQSLLCLEFMDFDDKEDIMQKISQQGTMYQELQLYKAMAATLAAKYEPELTGGLLNGAPQPMPRKAGEAPKLDKGTGESSHVSKARERAQTASQPGGSTA